MMKKTLSVLMSAMLFVLILAPVGRTAQAAGARDYPTVVVPGYSSTDLYLDGEQLWRLDKDAILNTVLEKIAQYGRGLGELALQRPEYLCDVLGRDMLDYVGKLAMRPDGSSVYDVVTYENDPARTSYSYLFSHEHGDHIHEYEVMKDIAKQYGSNGNDRLFAYQQDFRRSQVDCAEELDRYIDAVLEYTGSEKVNIIAFSHGGQTVAAYLSMFGREKNVVNNILMIVPAIGGVAPAYDLLSETAVFDEETLVRYIENSELLEEDVNWLVRADRFGVLDDAINLLVHRYIKQILGYWGSVWDFVPSEYYDKLKDEQLDPVASADLIAKSDRFHHEILANITETFSACEDEGMNIYIVAGSGMPSLTGLQVQSDFIVPVSSSTGAKTAPYGKRFNDGYPQSRAVCADGDHDHLSPDMCVDVSCGYLPDSTWIVNGMYHGNTWKDPYCRELCKTLLFSDERVDVLSYPEYPQFRYSSALNYAVTATLDHSPQGYWSRDDIALQITNLSAAYQMRLISISVEGTDASFDVKKTVELDPGASCDIPLRGAIPGIGGTTVDITINYSLTGCKTPLGCRTLVFTLKGGKAPAYDPSSPYTDALRETAFDKSVPEGLKGLTQHSAFFDFLKMIVDSMLAAIRAIRAMLSF